MDFLVIQKRTVGTSLDVENVVIPSTFHKWLSILPVEAKYERSFLELTKPVSQLEC